MALEPKPRLRSACSSTMTFCTPHITLPPPPPPPPSLQKVDTHVATQMTLFAGDAFDAAQWLIASSDLRVPPCVLDFASDSEPGGGWKGKQRGTQEEDLCRRSNLGVCLEEHFRRVGLAEYMPHSSAVYVPDVIVLRGSKSYRLLPMPFWVSVIAAALRSTGSDMEIRTKIDGILHIAGYHGHRQIVLGAWGCGAFGNDAENVARHMACALRHCNAWFDHVVFAIPSGHNFVAYQSALPGCEVVARSMESPSNIASTMHLPDVFDMLISTLPDVAVTAVTRAAVDPAEYLCRSGLQRAAKAMLIALKASCLDELAATIPSPLLERLLVILPPDSCTVGGVISYRSELERDICDTFREASQQLVREIVADQLQNLRL